MVGVIVEQYYRTVFNLACHPFANTVGGGGIFPIKTVNIIYKSKEFFTGCLKRFNRTVCRQGGYFFFMTVITSVITEIITILN